MVPEATPDEAERLRSAVQDACSHGGPCATCQTARVLAVMKAIERERVEALREIKARVEQGNDATLLLPLLTAALDGVQRDTSLDTATMLIAKCHTALRRVKTPRTDPDLLQDLVAYLAGQGIAVADE
jgi:hypothetical protein